MTRLKMTRITQDSPYSPIQIELAVRDEVDAPSVATEGEQE